MDPARELHPIRAVPRKHVMHGVLRGAFDETPRPCSPLPLPSSCEKNNADAPFNEEAFTEFVKKHVRQVSEHARWMHVPRETAEDILQLALEKLFPHRSEIERSRWEGWLRTAMLLCSLHHLRCVRRARRKKLDITFLLQNLHGNASPEVNVYQRECASELLGMLSRLPPERREVVSLHLIDDLPLKEAAARLGIPENTAKARWRLACADMGLEWERARAQERSKSRIAAFLTAAAVLLLSLWRRGSRWTTRRGAPLLACAAGALMLTEPTPPAPSEGPSAAEELPASDTLARAVPPASNLAVGSGAATTRSGAIAPAPPPLTAPAPARPSTTDRHASAPPSRASRASWAPSAQDRGTPRRQEPGPLARPAVRVEMAHLQLIRVLDLHQQGRTEAARDLLNLYRLTFTDDPLPDQRAFVAEAVNTP